MPLLLHILTSAARNASTIDFFDKRKMNNGSSRLATEGQISPDFQAANLRYGSFHKVGEMTVGKPERRRQRETIGALKGSMDDTAGGLSPPGSHSPLRKFTQEVDIKNITRAHNVFMQGQIGHGRNNTQSINFQTKGLCQANGFMHGWGLREDKLKQGPVLQKVNALPAAQQSHKKYWDHEAGQVNLKTTGWNSAHMDAKLGVALEEYEGLSVRQKR